MLDMRVQIKGSLEHICDNVKMSFPEGKPEFPLVTYGEVTNLPVEKWHDRVEFQIDCFSFSFESCIDLAMSICDMMQDIGFTRTYITPDSKTKEEEGVYHKSMNFVAHVNTIERNIFGGI